MVQSNFASEVSAFGVISQQAAYTIRAERLYDQLSKEGKIGCPSTSHESPAGHLLHTVEHAVEGVLTQGIAATRKFISEALEGAQHIPEHIPSIGHHVDSAIQNRVAAVEKENESLKGELNSLKSTVSELTAMVKSLSMGSVKVDDLKSPVKEEKAEDEDDFDMFGSDEEEDEEAEKLKAERLEAYAAKKAKKPGVIAKSSVVLDVKPWDDETNMQEMEKMVKTIQKDGLVWGASKLVPVGYGIQKLQVMCVVEDEKVSIEELTEEIEEFEELVQSVDIAAFNKI